MRPELGLPRERYVDAGRRTCSFATAVVDGIRVFWFETGGYTGLADPAICVQCMHDRGEDEVVDDFIRLGVPPESEVLDDGNVVMLKALIYEMVATLRGNTNAA